MNFKRYFGKIKNEDKKPKHTPKIVKETEQNIIKKENVDLKKNTA